MQKITSKSVPRDLMKLQKRLRYDDARTSNIVPCHINNTLPNPWQRHTPSAATFLDILSHYRSNAYLMLTCIFMKHFCSSLLNIFQDGTTYEKQKQSLYLQIWLLQDV